MKKLSRILFICLLFISLSSYADDYETIMDLRQQVSGLNDDIISLQNKITEQRNLHLVEIQRYKYELKLYKKNLDTDNDSLTKKLSDKINLQNRLILSMNRKLDYIKNPPEENTGWIVPKIVTLTIYILILFILIFSIWKSK